MGNCKSWGIQLLSFPCLHTPPLPRANSQDLTLRNIFHNVEKSCSSDMYLELELVTILHSRSKVTCFPDPCPLISFMHSIFRSFGKRSGNQLSFLFCCNRGMHFFPSCNVLMLSRTKAVSLWSKWLKSLEGNLRCTTLFLWTEMFYPPFSNSCKNLW